MNGTGTKAVAGRKKRTMSAAARRKISLAQKARWGKAEGNTEADHPSGGQKANRGSAEGAVGEDEERRDDSRVTVAHKNECTAITAVPFLRPVRALVPVPSI